MRLSRDRVSQGWTIC